MQILFTSLADHHHDLLRRHFYIRFYEPDLIFIGNFAVLKPLSKRVTFVT